MTPDLGVGATEHRIELTGIDGRHPARAGRGRGTTAPTPSATPEAETGTEIELARLPRSQPVVQLLGKPGRIAGGEIRLVGQHGRCLMVLSSPVAVGTHTGNDVRSQRPDHPNVVAQNLVAPPLLEGLLPTEGVAEVDGAGEVLFRAIEPMRRQQFLGPQGRQGVGQLGPDFVLSAVAPRGGDERRANPLAFAQ